MLVVFFKTEELLFLFKIIVLISEILYYMYIISAIPLSEQLLPPKKLKYKSFKVLLLNNVFAVRTKSIHILKICYFSKCFICKYFHDTVYFWKKTKLTIFIHIANLYFSISYREINS